jgi:hypothetical protein
VKNSTNTAQLGFAIPLLQAAKVMQQYIGIIFTNMIVFQYYITHVSIC